MKPDTNEIIRRKFNKAVRLLGEVCGLAGKDSITFRVHHIDQGQPSAPVMLEPSHAPSRHPERPLPMPTPGQRTRDGEFLRDALGLELERRQTAARRWSAETNHLPALHHAPLADADWKSVHHKECASETMGTSSCDCGPIFLARFSGQTFAVGHDGRLERFTAPMKPADFIANEMAYHFDQSFDVSEWLLPLLAETMEFTTSGDGVTERFTEEPSESDIETRRALEL